MLSGEKGFQMKEGNRVKLDGLVTLSISTGGEIAAMTHGGDEPQRVRPLRPYMMPYQNNSTSPAHPVPMPASATSAANTG